MESVPTRPTIAFLTGTRADFGKLKPLIRVVHQRRDTFAYHVFVTGMHMLDAYGTTINEVSKEGFDNIFPFFNQEGTHQSSMDLALARTIDGFGHFVRERRVDLIIVHGDRIEALAGAIVGVLNNIRVAHIEGGEVSGTVDEVLRHSISKLAHTHLVANESARQRVIQMGEQPDSVMVIGSPDIDVMLSSELPTLNDVASRYDIPFRDYVIFCYHPVTTEIDHTRRNIRECLTALIRSPHNAVVILPNNDTGSESIREAISDLLDDAARFKVLPSMRFEYFLSLLKSARAIVGNSSAGIREAPVYAVPTVNIGSRQSGRHQADSIVNVPDDTDRILHTLCNLPQGLTPSYGFGRGDSARQFGELLDSGRMWTVPIQKAFRTQD
jgi:UDP-N-acetylglucosamine 2-epimerase (hydrolysing)